MRDSRTAWGAVARRSAVRTALVYAGMGTIATAAVALFAQVAIQQGRYAGRRIAQSLLSKPSPKSFRYFDKGNMAVIGAGFAILQAGRVRLSGIFAWLAWAWIHLQFLSTSSLRLTVFLQWIWSFLTGQTDVRLIVNHIPVSKQGSSDFRR